VPCALRPSFASSYGWQSQKRSKTLNPLSQIDDKYLSLRMRLSEFEMESIKTLALHHFGTDVHVFLFGSRTNDEKRGGDIDLFIRNQNEEYLNIRTKISFIADLMFKIGEQSIDVVLDKPEMKDSVFIKTIIQTGIQLC
jgi:predicted nucleotidyltransferase